MVGTLMRTIMRRIGILGEAMGELFTHNAQVEVGIGGDTFNAAVYLSQMSDQVQPVFFSAIGQDPFSQLLMNICQQYGIGTDAIDVDSYRNIGLYSIVNDEHGERAFHYWRSDSAAKGYLNNLLNRDRLTKWFACDALFFSGITLAIMSVDARSDLLDRIGRWHGGRVYFDDNFRPLLWQNDDVQECYGDAINAADVLMLSVEDQLSIQPATDKNELIEILACYRDKIIILRDGGQPITVIQNGHLTTIEIDSVVAVDTTAAGDSFSGTFIALYESGVDLISAIQRAAKVSALVVQQPGALVTLPESVLIEVAVRGDV
jgi:2-dehydro-3-deoxygluconokinase